jgi:hypothetical protein
MSLKEAAAYEKRGRQAVACETNHRRLCAIRDRRGEGKYFKREWLDAHLESMRSR